MTPIQRIVYELDVAGQLAKPDGLISLQDTRELIKRQLQSELEGHTSTMTREQAQGWQKCLRFLGVKE